jgi:hypothetical protein
MMRPVILALALVASACSYYDAEQMRNPLSANGLIGRSIVDAKMCMGLPDPAGREKLSDDLGQAEWSYKDVAPALAFSVPLAGSLAIGGGSACKMDVEFLRMGGTIVDLTFPQCNGTLFGGPYAGAHTLVKECEAHPGNVSLPKNYDSFAYFFPADPVKK